MSAVHQFVPTFEPGAVGAHMLACRHVIRDAGFESEIFAGEVHPGFADHDALEYRSYGRSIRAHSTDRLVYHVAIGSEVANFLLGRSETLVVNYHNLTPLRYLDAWDPVAAGGVVWGRRQLADLAQRCALGIADSQFNEADLVEARYARTTVVPILTPESVLAGEIDETVVARERAGDGAPTWLFVGRLAPNKAQHDLVKALAVYRRFYDSRARLRLVGGSSSPRYESALRGFVKRLGLAEAVEFVGSISDAEKRAYYETADVFVIVSEHEGFCVPLIEAMYHRLPIVAFRAGAVPETLGAAGLVLDTKDPGTIAAAVARVARDARLRTALVDAGSARREDFSIARSGPALVAALDEVEPK